MSKPLLSMVSPVYKGRDCLRKLVDEIDAACGQIGVDFEVILVDDACPENSWETIREISAGDPRVKGVKLSRNFGQHSAIEAGLGVARGDWIVVLDCDLQDHPRAIADLWEAAQDGADVVLARRQARTDRWDRKFFSAAFYGILSFLTGTKLSPEIANFGIYSRNVIDAYNSWSEEQKYFPVMIQWLGFEQKMIDVPHAERFFGKSSYNLRSLLVLGMRVVLSFSDRPLWIISLLGASVALLAMIASIFFFVRSITGDIEVQGWTSLVLSIWFLGGVNIACAGFLGMYLGRTLREAKGRPSYIVSQTVNLER